MPWRHRQVEVNSDAYNARMTRILGVHEAKPSGHRFPGAPWGREFVGGPGGTPLPESTTEAKLMQKVLREVRPHADAGGGAVVSIKLPLDSVRRGRWDSRLQALGEVVDADTTKIIINHEPENDTTIYPVDVFVPAFNRARSQIHQGARTAGDDLPEVCYAAMAYQWAPGRTSTKRPTAWSRDLVADRYLADVYVGKSWKQSTSLAEHPGLVRFLAEMVLAYPGRRTGLAEFGRLAHPIRSAMFAKDFEWLATDPIGQMLADVVLVWNTGGTERNAGWLLDRGSTEAVRLGLEKLAQEPS